MTTPEAWVLGSDIQIHPGPHSGKERGKGRRKERRRQNERGREREEGEEKEEQRGGREGERAQKLLLRRVEQLQPKLRSLRSRAGYRTHSW